MSYYGYSLLKWLYLGNMENGEGGVLMTSTIQLLGKVVFSPTLFELSVVVI